MSGDTGTENKVFLGNRMDEAYGSVYLNLDTMEFEGWTKDATYFSCKSHQGLLNQMKAHYGNRESIPDVNECKVIYRLCNNGVEVNKKYYFFEFKVYEMKNDHLFRVKCKDYKFIRSDEVGKYNELLKEKHNLTSARNDLNEDILNICKEMETFEVLHK